MMVSLLISGLTFLAVFGGTLSGVWLAGRLPEPHLSSESRTSISVSMAVVGTLAALVLSLMISNASAAFNTQKAAVADLAISILKLNHTLIHYGGQTEGMRHTLRTYAAAKAQEIQGAESSSALGVNTLGLLENVSDGILALQPASARDREIQQRALVLTYAITDARWTLAETEDSAVPYAFLIVLIFWLSLLFASFGLFAPRNATVVAALLLCALAISGGVFIILELGTPNSGLIHVSAAPIEEVVRQIGSTRD